MTSPTHDHDALPAASFGDRPDRPDPASAAAAGRRRPRLAAGIAVVAGVVVSFLGGLVALVLTAWTVATAWVFVTAGFVAVAAISAALTGLLLRRRLPRRQRRVVAAVTAAVALGLFAVAVLRPMGDPQLPPRSVPGMEYWDLPTGSRIAVAHSSPPAPGRSNAEPIVFLHGGPGVADLAGAHEVFGRLSSTGRDVYVYDQVGSGWSGRLDDPRDYTVERHAADLEAIRQRIGAATMVLVAHSWGAEIAGVYAAAHPDRVAALVLLAPGGVPGAGDDSGSDLQRRLTSGERFGVYRLLVHPRALLGYALTQINSPAAHALVGDAEMDARYDRIYARTLPALHCHGYPIDPDRAELHGLGYYSWQYPQSAGAPAAPDVRAELSALAPSTLVMKPSCDYLSWTAADSWHQAIPDAQLVYLEQAGHNFFEERPGAVVATITRFLAGDTVATMAWPSQPPPSFEGRP